MTRMLSWSVLAVTLLATAKANEWMTSRDFYCIERCKIRKVDDEEMYTCFTVDGKSTSYDSERGISTTGRAPPFKPDQLDDLWFPWDYCTPAKLITEEENVHNDQGGYEGGYNDGNGGYNGDFNDGFNPGSASSPTSIPGKDCNGACRKDSNNVYMCTVHGSNDKTYCSPDMPLTRQQISSKNKLWCMDACVPNAGNIHRCTTMLGKDICSPNKGYSTKRTQCMSVCAVHEKAGTNDLTCEIDDNNYEPCGDWEVAKGKDKLQEYTQDQQVCAGPCEDHGGDKICTYLAWKQTGDKDHPTAELYMKEGDCGAASGTNWTLIGIVIGSVIGAIILIAVIGVAISRKKGFDPVSTN